MDHTDKNEPVSEIFLYCLVGLERTSVVMGGAFSFSGLCMLGLQYRYSN